MKNDGFLSLGGILLCLGISGACASSSKETLKEEVSREEVSKTETKTHKEKGPVLKLKFREGPLSDGSDGLPAHGPIDSLELKGPSTTDIDALKKEKEREKAKTEGQKESDFAPALSCVSVGWLYGIALLGVVWLAIRFLKGARP